MENLVHHEQAYLTSVHARFVRLEGKLADFEDRLARVENTGQGGMVGTAHSEDSRPAKLIAGQVKALQAEITELQCKMDEQKIETAEPANHGHIFDHIKLERNLWDAAHLIGVGRMPLGANLHLASLIAIHGFLLTMFTYITWESLAPSTIKDSTPDDLKQWRLRHGHHQMFMSDDHSVVARVCGGYNSMATNEHYKDLVDLIRDYNEKIMNRLAVGPTLCLISMFCWTLSVLKEILAIRHLLERFFAIPVGYETLIEIVGHGKEKKTALIQLTSHRFVLANAFLVLRSFVAVTILFGGLKWLAQTVRLDNLVLNAVALEFVFDLDERMYGALAPNRFVDILNKDVYIPRRSAARACFGLLPLIWTCLALIIVAISLVWLIPQLDNMSDAEGALCSGNVNFVFTPLAVYPYYGWSSTIPMPSYEYEEVHAVWQKLAGVSDFGDNVTAQLITAPSVETAMQRPAVQLSAFETYQALQATGLQGSEEPDFFVNPACQDLGGSENWSSTNTFALQSHLEVYGGFPQDCNDGLVILACRRPGLVGEAARTFCPVTCQCHMPSSLHVLPGCPPQCEHTLSYELGLASKDCCTDTPYAELSRNAAWRQVTEFFRVDAGRQWATASDMFFLRVADNLQSKGCRGISDIKSDTGFDLCQHDSPTPGSVALRYPCPVTCGCTAQKRGCPSGQPPSQTE